MNIEWFISSNIKEITCRHYFVGIKELFLKTNAILKIDCVVGYG